MKKKIINHIYSTFCLGITLVLSTSCTKEVINVPLPEIYSAVSAGGSHSLALEPDGTLWAWGHNGHGQLGDRTTGSKSTPVKIGTGYSAISAGNDFSLALKKDGTMWAWGNNDDGQLGDGTEVNRSMPVQIGSGYASINAQNSVTFFSFSHSLVLKNDGTIWAWGSNIHGQLGDGTEMDKNVPVQIGSGYSAIAVGGFYSIAVKTDGTMYVFGRSNNGTPDQIGTGYVAVAAGPYHSLALKTNGTLWSWGSNTSGELGDGTNVSKGLPIKIGTDFEMIVASGHDGSFFNPRDNSHSLALKSNGTLWAWGGNSGGQLGDGTFIDKNSPVQIGSEYIAVSTGPYHVLALKSDGTLWSWGGNFSGQLGDGTNIDTNKPMQIGGH